MRLAINLDIQESTSSTDINLRDNGISRLTSYLTPAAVFCVTPETDRGHLRKYQNLSVEVALSMGNDQSITIEAQTNFISAVDSQYCA